MREPVVAAPGCLLLCRVVQQGRADHVGTAFEGEQHPILESVRNIELPDTYIEKNMQDT